VIVFIGQIREGLISEETWGMRKRKLSKDEERKEVTGYQCRQHGQYLQGGKICTKERMAIQLTL
jgi:hypothetical protein